MTARTIVGSGPARRPLPLGREAVERALRLCRYHGGVTAERSSEYAFARRRAGLHDMWISLSATWLPADISNETVEQLRERLRGYP